MRHAIGRSSNGADIVVMAAAVADYTPAKGQAAGKIEKTDAPLELTLVRTVDILAELGRARGGAARPVLIGFAAESGDPVARGREKLQRKAADLIVANDISRIDGGFDSDMNAATIIGPNGEEPFPLGPKTVLAARLLDHAERLLDARVAK
jgi:phosphopantothenoylcysteine decarboxylase/phosphopantothenate--cysteine ligase